MGISITRNDILMRASSGHVVQHPQQNRGKLIESSTVTQRSFVEDTYTINNQTVMDRPTMGVSHAVRITHRTIADKTGLGHAEAQNPQSPIERTIRFHRVEDIGFPMSELVCWGGVWMHVSYVGELNNRYAKWLSTDQGLYPAIKRIRQWHGEITQLFIERLAPKLRTVKNRNGDIGDTYNVHAEDHLFTRVVESRTDTILNRTNKTWGTKYAPKDWSE